MGPTYFHFSLDFCRLEKSEYWSATLHSFPEELGQKDARWHGCGRLDVYTLHDIQKVLDSRIASAFYGVEGIQTVIDF